MIRRVLPGLVLAAFLAFPALAQQASTGSTAASGVSSFAGRANAVTPAANDYAIGQIAGAEGLQLVGDQDCGAAFTWSNTIRNVEFDSHFSVPRTCTLPDASTMSAGHVLFFKDNGGINGANTLTLAAFAGQHFDIGASNIASLALTASGSTFMAYSNGNNGFVIQLINNLPPLGAGQIYVGNASSVTAAVTLSGDCTLSNAGAITCTKTNGTAFSAFATAALTGGGTQCVQVNNAGTPSGTGAGCGGSGSQSKYHEIVFTGTGAQTVTTWSDLPASWPVFAGVKGPGGGAGGCGTTGQPAAPGGEGGAAVRLYTTLVANTAYTYHIGTGGAAGSHTGPTAGGAAGGNSDFSDGTTTISGSSGAGGVVCNASSKQTAGGTGTNGDTNQNYTGASGWTNSNTQSVGVIGVTIQGFAATAGLTTGSTGNGVAGSGCGAPGSGGIGSTGDGAAGSNGCGKIWTWYHRDPFNPEELTP